MTAPAVSVIIVTFNSAKTVTNCLDALARAASAIAIELIVWDNASADATVALIKRHPLAAGPRFTLIASSENLGFGRGNNGAAAYATAPRLLLLNPDAFLDEPASITSLATVMDSCGAGIVGPFLANEDGSHQVGDAGDAETIGVAAAWAIGLNLLPGVRGSFLSRSCPLHSSPLRVDWVCGACLMIEHRLFDLLGGFDETIFLYSEDVDLCLRARRLGTRIRYVPSVRVRHIQGVSLSNRISTIWLDSRFMLFARAQPTRSRQMMFAAILAGGFAWRQLAYSLAERWSSRHRGRDMAKRMRVYRDFAAARIWPTATIASVAT